MEGLQFCGVRAYQKVREDLILTNFEKLLLAL